MMLGKAAWPVLLAAALAPWPAMADPAPALAVPSLEAIPVDGGVRIEGRVRGVAPGRVDASLDLARKDSSGSTATRQSRSLDVSAGSSDVVANTQISTAPGAQLDVTLTLSADGRAFARSELHLAPEGDASAPSDN